MWPIFVGNRSARKLEKHSIRKKKHLKEIEPKMTGNNIEKNIIENM